MRRLVILLCLCLLAAAPGRADGGRVLVQSTTSTQNSGLYERILPAFEAETGIRVDVVAVGTGQAIRNAARGDGDLLIVHDEEAELAFVASGHGLERRDLMHNDFVIVGPEDDPAGLAAAEDPQDALARIAAARAPFLSRGDDSGTHRFERRLWAALGRDPAAFGGWYRETGAGMGATLRVATEMDGYVLTDRGTWLAYRGKAGRRILFEDREAMRNVYGVTLVNPGRHPHVNAAGARALFDWLTGPEGQAAIGAYRIDGEPLFRPAAD